MSENITFTMIKPAAVADGHTGAILAKIAEGGFRIAAMRMLQLSKKQAEIFYAVHSDRPFFQSLVDSMSSGPIVAAMLEKDNAVQAYRNHIGATNPADAAEGSIRRLFGKSVQDNAVHGSDSDENALIEANFFFNGMDKF